jgi:hypothetical protein
VYNRFHKDLVTVAALSFSLLVCSNYFDGQCRCGDETGFALFTNKTCSAGQTQSRIVGRGAERRRERERERGRKGSMKSREL